MNQKKPNRFATKRDKTGNVLYDKRWCYAFAIAHTAAFTGFANPSRQRRSGGENLL